MPDATTCPFCNALIAAPIADPASGKIHCPRCDESFPVNRNVGEAGPPIDAEVQRHRQSRQATGWRSMHSLLLAGILLVVFGTALGLGIAYLNREKNTQTPHVNVETAKPVAPAEMPGLRYLPADTDSVIAVQFRPLLDALPDKQPKDHRTLLTWIGLPADFVATLEKVVPIGLENIDQLVLGLRLKDELTKHLVLVVHTHEAFSMEAIVGKLGAKKQKIGNRAIYHAPESAKFSLDFYLWAPNDRVLVIALDSKAIEQPREGIEHLSPRLVEIAQTQFAPDAYFWAVFDSEHWESLGLFLLGLAPEQRQAFEKFDISLSVVRTVTLGVRTHPEPSLAVWFEMKTDKTATEFRGYLNRRLKDEGDSVAIGGAGNKVMLQTPIQSGELRSLIQKLLPPKKK